MCQWSCISVEIVRNCTTSDHCAREGEGLVKDSHWGPGVHTRYACKGHAQNGAKEPWLLHSPVKCLKAASENWWEWDKMETRTNTAHERRIEETRVWRNKTKVNETHHAAKCFKCRRLLCVLFASWWIKAAARDETGFFFSMSSVLIALLLLRLLLLLYWTLLSAACVFVLVFGPVVWLPMRVCVRVL